jgi:cold shock protein
MNEGAQNETITGQTGTVKWFDPKKGFGFIVGPQGQDIFVHFSRIEGEGFRVLKDQTTVDYDAEMTPTGWRATRVVRREPVEVTIPPRRGYSRSPRRS